MRSLGPIKRLITVVAAIGLLVGNSGIANADSRTINFEPPAYHLGTVQDQPGVTSPPAGWGGSFPPGAIDPLIDQSVVDTAGRPASFGQQSWRISNAYTTGAFAGLPFSPSLTNEAGEKDAQNRGYSGGSRQNHFDARWAFISADSGNLVENGSRVSTSPDRGDGARMSYVRLEDHPWGVELHFSDYRDNVPYGDYGSPLTAAPGCGAEDEFTDILVATVSREEPHTFRLSIDFIDGPRNDVVKVYVDDHLKYTGTTWEDYFRWCTESGGGTGSPTFDQSRTVDSLLFRVGGTPQPANLHKGFFFDNLSYASSMRPTCSRHGDGNGDIEDGHGGHGHAQFHKSGCDNSGSDSVRHDDDQSGHHFQSSSVNSSEYSTTASGGRSITMVGTGTDNGLPVGFTMVAVDNDGLLPATYSIVLTNGYSFVGTFLTGSVVSIQ